MNSTTGQTAITITTVKPAPQASIQKRVIYNARGEARVKEFIRGIQL